MKRKSNVNKANIFDILTLVLFAVILSIITAYSIVILDDPGVAFICMVSLLLALRYARAESYVVISLGLGTSLLITSGVLFFGYRINTSYFTNSLIEAMSENLGAIGFFFLLGAGIAMFIAMIDNVHGAFLKNANEKISKHKIYRTFKLCALLVLILLFFLPIWPTYGGIAMHPVTYISTSKLSHTYNSTFNVSPYYNLQTVCGNGADISLFTLSLSSKDTFSVMVYSDIADYASDLSNLRVISDETYANSIAVFSNRSLYEKLNMTRTTISLPTNLSCIYLLTIVNQPTQLNMSVKTVSTVINSEAEGTTYTYVNTTLYSNWYIWNGMKTLAKVYHKAFSGTG